MLFLQNSRQIYPKGQTDRDKQFPEKWSSAVPNQAPSP